MISRMRFTLNKKGSIEFVFSKLAFLIFGIIILSVFFYFIDVQKNIHNLDTLAKKTETIVQTAGMIQSSPFNLGLVYYNDFKINFTISNATLTASDGTRSLTTGFYMPINYNSSFYLDNCAFFSKIGNITVIDKCQ